jgi:hypothetical protein
MSVKRPFTREQRTTIVYGMLAFVVTLVVLQLWLFTATMNAYLGGDESVVLPAAIASAFCLLLNAGAAPVPLLHRAHPAMSAGAPDPPASALATMHPAYFAMVMATGIVSIATYLVEWRPIAAALVWLNVAFYAALWILTAARLLRYPDRVAADFTHHGRAVGFFTTVAATCVLGSQFVIVRPVWSVAAALWVVGIVLWAGLTYGIFTALTVKEVKPTLADGINGGWLVAVVAAQSVSVLGVQLAAGFAPYERHVLLFCLALWLGGGMLYVWIISLIFYRYTFFPLSPSDLARRTGSTWAPWRSRRWPGRC